jgi:hypothetical protein
VLAAGPTEVARPAVSDRRAAARLTGPRPSRPKPHGGRPVRSRTAAGRGGTAVAGRGVFGQACGALTGVSTAVVCGSDGMRVTSGSASDTSATIAMTVNGTV